MHPSTSLSRRCPPGVLHIVLNFGYDHHQCCIERHGGNPTFVGLNSVEGRRSVAGTPPCGTRPYGARGPIPLPFRAQRKGDFHNPPLPVSRPQCCDGNNQKRPRAANPHKQFLREPVDKATSVNPVESFFPRCPGHWGAPNERILTTEGGDERSPSFVDGHSISIYDGCGWATL